MLRRMRRKGRIRGSKAEIRGALHPVLGEACVGGVSLYNSLDALLFLSSVSSSSFSSCPSLHPARRRPPPPSSSSASSSASAAAPAVAAASSSSSPSTASDGDKKPMERWTHRAMHVFGSKNLSAETRLTANPGVKFTRISKPTDRPMVRAV